MEAAYSINREINKNLRVGALGLSCGLVQNPLILFKSVFLTLETRKHFFHIT